MELPHIDKDIQSMTSLVVQVNNLLDTIVGAFNTLESTDEKITIVQESVEALQGTITSANEEDSQSVLDRIVGKNFKFGKTNGTTVKKNSLYVDRVDSKLKFKDDSDTITSIT